MGKYTTRGSAALDRRIDADLSRMADAVSPHSIAGILLGGYGRGEGTPFILPDGSQAPFNDYDLVVVVEELNPAVRRTLRALEIKLTEDVGLPVDLCPYLKADLAACEFSLLNYEMKYGHKVVWGDPDILSAMPAYPHNAIPSPEGSRLLLNRGKLLLDIRQRLAESDPLSGEEQIRFLKFIYKTWLALGDALLLGGQKYDLLYAVKRDRIEDLVDIPHRDAVIAGYKRAIALREWGDYYALLKETDLEEEFHRVRAVYLDLAPWYRRYFPGRTCSFLKATVLNLKWNGRPLPYHPRTYLYAALEELLQDEPNEFRLREMLFCRSGFTDRFYALQTRFC